MTQIQAYESMSKEALIEHHRHTLQQHADDMDMLSKELASRAAPIELRVVADILAEGNGFWATCSGCHESDDGRPTGPYSQVMQCTLGVGCRECGGIGAIWDTTDYDEMADAMFGTIRDEIAAPVAAQAQWIEHCNITDIPDAVLTPSGLAIKNEQADTSVGKTPETQGLQVDGADKMQGSLATKAFTDCTCPSGNGSLRWPCPVHPPC